MSQPVQVKICGVTSAAAVAGAVRAGARYLGFNFYPPSPRCLTPETARGLMLDVPEGVAKVALVVDPTDEALGALLRDLPVDFVQLHGHESPARVAEIRARFGLPIIKAVGIAEADDLNVLDRFLPVCDQILVDAKPAKGAALPGGNGLAFDWRLLQGRDWQRPWLLAGGLTADNVAAAIRLTGARQVDVSSGVESAPGIKDPAAMHAFVAAAQSDEGAAQQP
ncbi:MAG: phosphoribosylanthranilate isomerase [Roseinatronobacter sp.]|jgi:phosphoribosylanthranilate isomerase|nr:phosphoribosylanthranilate isomerase [Roseinatronobacter sp.]